MGVIVTGHNSPTGFQNSEAVTVANLNSHVNSATFATSSVDNSSIELTNTNTKLRLKDATNTTSGTTLAKLQHIATNKFLGRTSANDGAVESVDISAIANLLRPKFVAAGTSGSTALSNQLNSGTGNTDYTYQISQFTSTDSDFGSYLQIVAVHIDCFAQSEGALNQVYSYYPDGVQNLMCAAGAYSTGDAIQAETNSVIPINSGQSTFTIRHARQSTGGGADSTFSAIRGFTIIPNLPTS